MVYFDSPAKLKELKILQRPSEILVNNCAGCLRAFNPQLIDNMVQDYSISLRTTRTLARLRTTLAQLNQTDQLVPQQVVTNLQDSFSFDLLFSLQGQFCIGSVEVSLGPKVNVENSSGRTKTSTSLNFEISFDQLNGKKEAGVKGSASIRDNNVEATVAVGTDLSQDNRQRSVTIQTKGPNRVNVGLQVKDSGPLLLSPSNIVDKGSVQISHYFKAKGVEGDTTIGALPFQTIKDLVAGQNRDKNQPTTQQTVAETGSEREEARTARARSYTQQVQVCVAHYEFRRPRAVVDTALPAIFVALYVCSLTQLFYFFNKVESRREGACTQKIQECVNYFKRRQLVSFARVALVAFWLYFFLAFVKPLVSFFKPNK